VEIEVLLALLNLGKYERDELWWGTKTSIAKADIIPETTMLSRFICWLKL